MRKYPAPLALALVLFACPTAFAKGFVWSEKPSLDNVPSDGVRGEIDGRAVPITNLQIIGDKDGWKFEMRESADFMSEGPRISVRQEVKQGTLAKKAFGGYDGCFLQMKKDGKSPTSLNTDTGFVVEFKDWQVQPFGLATKGKAAGTASGRLAVVYSWDKGSKKAWFAGTFKDVPVKYERSTPLCALSCVRPETYDPKKFVATPAAAPAKYKPSKPGYADQPTLGMASGALAGNVDGKAMSEPKLEITGNKDGWVVSVGAKAGELTVGPNITLTKTPVAGAVYASALGGGGTSTDVIDHADASNTTQWPGTAAYIVEFTAFEAKPFDAAMKNVTTDVGKASGRLVVTLKGAEGYKDSWVAGTFKDAPVSIYRDPPACATSCE